MKKFDNIPADSELSQVFVDQAWGNMKVLLDKEMPIERKRKRAIWWWIVLLPVTIGLGGYAYLVSENPKPAKPVHEYTKPIAKQEPTLRDAGLTNSIKKMRREEEQISQTLPEIHESANIDVQDDMPLNFNKETHSIQAKNKLNNSTLSNDNTRAQTSINGYNKVILANISTSNIPAQTFIKIPKNTIDANKKNQIIFPKIGDNKNDVIPEIAVNTLENKRMLNLSKLPSIDYKLLDINKNMTNHNYNSKKPIVDHKKKVHFGLKTSANLGVKEVLGLSVVTMLEVPVAKKWSVNIEPEYALLFYKKDRSIIPNQVGADLFVVDTSITSSLDQYATGEKNIRLNYLRLPIHISWNLSSKFSLYSGLGVGILLNKIRLNTIAKHANNTSDNLDPQLNNPNIEQETKNNIPIFRKFDSSVSLGVRYFATRKFGLDFRYRQGMRLASDNTSEYNGQFQFGLVYIMK